MKKCVFAGSFDPPTTGHKKIVEDCLKIFDQTVVAVMVNTRKTSYLTVEQRLFLLNKLFADEPRVKVISFGGAAVDVLAAENTPFYVRGIRNGVDLDYENADFYANCKLNPDIVTIYLPSRQEDIQISSTLVKNSVRFGKSYKGYVPAEIEEDFRKMTEDKDV